MLELARLKSRKDVEAALACEAVLQAIHFSGSRSFYREMRIRKRGKRGGFRQVFKTEHRPLAAAQKEIAAAINREYSFSDCVQGFVPKRSIRTNAERHLGKNLVMHMDIADFFGSIRGEQVAEGFRRLGCGDEACAELRLLCTLHDRLVPGASASPALANLVFEPFDLRLQELCRATDSSYTRYADDLAFSGERVPTPKDVAEILNAGGFRINWAKHRLQWRGKPQYVTGLSVADPEMPHAPRAVKRYLRTFLFFAEKFGLEEHLERIGVERAGPVIGRIDGWMSYLHGVDPPASVRFGRRWLQILDAAGYTSRAGARRRHSTCAEILDQMVAEHRANRTRGTDEG